MPTPHHPEVLRGRRYTLGFMWLHNTLDVFVNTNDPNSVRAHNLLVMKEWKEDACSWSTGGSRVVGEGAGGAEEVDQAGEGADGDRGSDTDYRG